MTQRNPMNDRNTGDSAKKGVTRKSASSAKPKRAAAGSVYTVEKSEKIKKQIRKEQEKKLNEKKAAYNKRFYDVPTEQYRRLRRMWWICIIFAIAFTAVAFALNTMLPQSLTIVMMVLAYLLIFAAIYIDMFKIRKIRREYQASHSATKEESRERREKQKAERAAAAKAEAAPAEPEKKGVMGKLFGSKK